MIANLPFKGTGREGSFKEPLEDSMRFGFRERTFEAWTMFWGQIATLLLEGIIEGDEEEEEEEEDDEEDEEDEELSWYWKESILTVTWLK